MTLAETAARFDLGPYWRTSAADGRGASSILSGTEGSLLYFFSPDGVRTYLVRTQAPFAVEQIQRAVGAQIDGRFGDATRLSIIRAMRADGINIADTTPAVGEVVAYALRRAFHDGRGAVALPARFLYPNPSTAVRASGRSTLLQAIDTSTGQAVPVTQANASAPASQRTETVTQYTPPTTTSQTTPTQGAERYVPMPPQPGSTGGTQTVQNYAGTQTTQTTTSTTQGTAPVPHTMPSVPNPTMLDPATGPGSASFTYEPIGGDLAAFEVRGIPRGETATLFRIKSGVTQQLFAATEVGGVVAFVNIAPDPADVYFVRLGNGAVFRYPLRAGQKLVATYGAATAAPVASHYLNVEALLAQAQAMGIPASEMDRALLADRSIAAPTTDGDRGYYKAIGLLGAAMATTGLVAVATR
jgi:hypothetical protein